MNYQSLVDKGLLRKESFKPEQIAKTIERAEQDIHSGKLLLEKGFETTAYKVAYEAMLLAGRALVFSYGLRPRTSGSHKIVVEFTAKVLGNDYKILVSKFDRARKKRHGLIYEARTVSRTEAQNIIKTAVNFIGETKKHIQNRNPQQKLF